MAFGKKRSPIDRLWEDYGELEDGDKEEFKKRLQDIDKAEDEREVDKIEEDKAETPAEADEKKEEVKEESEEIGEKVDETEKLDAEDEKSSEDEESSKDEKDDKLTEMYSGIDARLKAIEDIVFGDEDDEDEDAGLSGYGKKTDTDHTEDGRYEDVIKKLGGRA